MEIIIVFSMRRGLELWERRIFIPCKLPNCFNFNKNVFLYYL